MLISNQTFKGIRPAAAAHKLGADEAQEAANCVIHKGDLRPWDNEQVSSTLTGTGTIQTIYRYLSQYWFEWEADVDILESPIAADTAYRRYYTGDGIPKKTNEDEATTGSGAMPINFYPMGAPVPAHAPSGVAGAGGSGDDRDMSYLWTIVTSWGEESAPSTASDTVTAKNGQTVSLSSMTIVWQASTDYTTDHWVYPSTGGAYVYKCVQAGTSGGSEPTWGTTIDGDTTDSGCKWRCYKYDILFSGSAEKRIYRTNSGDQHASWQYVAAIAMAATTYSDSVLDADLGAVLPSQYSYPQTGITVTWDPPPDGLTGIVSLGSFFAGFTGNQICFSEPNYPHAWPEAYRQTVDTTVVVLGAIGKTLIVATEKHPYVFNGATPAAMTPTKLPSPAPCLAKRGLVMFPTGAFYPTNNGLYFTDGASGQVVTKGFFDADDWSALYPATFNAIRHQGKYFGFYDYGDTEGGIVIDFDRGEITELGFYPTALYVDDETDTLYYVREYSDLCILLETGTSVPSRTDAMLLETGDKILLE